MRCSSKATIAAVMAIANSVVSPVGAHGSDIAVGFANPPESCALQTWWHWIDNCVTKEGISRDLKAMSEAGISVAHVFAPRMTNLSPTAKTMTPEWLDLFSFAISEAKRNGIALGFHNCPGWSSSGGPWIGVGDSMKCIVSSAKDVRLSELSGATSLALPRPPSKLDFYHDVRAFAFPVKLPPRRISGEAPDAILIGGKDKVELEYEYAQAFSPSVAVLDLKVQSFCMKAEVSAEVGGRWEKRGEKDFVLFHSNDSPRTVSLAEGAPARRWKFCFTPLPDPGWIRRRDLPVRSIELGNWPYADGREAIRADQIVDLGNVVKGDVLAVSALRGKLPDGADGAWRVLRVGYTTTGARPSPSTVGGLECDKLDRKGLAAHWKGMPERILSLPGAKGVVKYAIIDSYEVGAQTWTETLPERFVEMKNREIWPTLPAVLGYRVESDSATAKLKVDFDGVLGELYARNYYDYFAELCRRAGIVALTEAYGGPFDSVRCWREVDVPMCEFWISREENARARLHSSVDKAVAAARKFGKNIVAAEAFSAEAPAGRWQATPAQLRLVGDAAWVAGVNRFVYHSYLHQPYTNRVPGTSLHRYGTQLNVNTTWWSQMHVWTDYVRRGQFLLQFGRIAKDRHDVLPGKIEALVREGDGGERIWFLRNKSASAVRETLALDCSLGMDAYEFDAARGRIVEARRSDGGVEVELAPGESAFIVFASGVSAEPRVAPGAEAADLSHGWSVTSFSGVAAPAAPVAADPLFDWSKSTDDGIKFFSGAATYVRDGEFPAGILDLGELHDLAEVRVDGKLVGTAAYRPYRVEIPAGRRLEVKVVNTWPNQLIGDARRVKRGEKPFTWTNWKGWNADDEPLPAGLLGPVKLYEARRADCRDGVSVQRPDASGSVVGGLKWTLAGKYAKIQGDKLVVEIPESAHPADAIAVAELPKGIYDGMEGLSFSVHVRGEAVAKPTKPWLGLKCQIHVQEPGGESYANGDADGVVGDFDETISSDVSFKTPRPDRVMLNLGLQGTSGKAVFDLSTLRCGRIDGRFAHVKGNFRRVNGDKRVSYPKRVGEDRRRRGVMLPGREPTKDDFKTLADWGVTLVRYQMVGAPKGKDVDLDAYNRWLDGKLSVLERIVLPEARKYGMKVVVDLHAAPGGYDKLRGMTMLRGGKYADAFVDLWRRIATRFRGNEDVIYGYDLVNEPNQSRRAAIDYWTIQRKAAEAIREIDRETPIIVESNGWGVPSTYSYMSPLALDNVIYQVHCYEPMDFTHQGIAGRPCGASWPDKPKGRDRDFLRRQLAPVREFEKRHGAKIYVGEFSAAAWAKGAENYIADMIAICEEYGWDWTYHAFREYKGWSVEHEATSPDDIRPSNGNPRKSVLLDGLRRTTPGVVSFKDAAKIKSWDAWNDHKGPQAKKERRSVTWEKLQKLDSGLEPSGFLATRSASEIKSSKWSIGCETMDRDYADWDQFKQYVGMIGAKHGRLFSGWAKTEQEKGKYDFTWLDPQVREMAAMGVKPWICLSYGNPVYGSDFRLGMRVRQVTDKPEAFDAWIRYCTACVERYKDVVDEWEVWNEPFGQGPEYAEMFYRTAKAIRAVQPKSKIFCTAVNMKADYVCVLEKLKKENALDLGSYFIYHPYVPVPEWPFVSLVKPLRDLVKSYSPDFDVMQGECGCPAQLEFEHAMHSIEWTEYSQAKWNLRHVVGDAVRNVPCSVFTMIDLQYTFMLQSFGMLRSNTLKEVVYRRPSFYAMQHVFSYFDDDVRAVSVGDVDHGGRKITVARFERNSVPVYVMWFSGKRPDDTLAYEPTTFEIPGEAVKNPVWADLLTGKVGKLSDANVSAKDGVLSFRDLPLWDSPIMVTEDSQVPRRRGGEPVRLLVVGNSLVRHGVAPKLGWTNDWGMAASAREKDFAHLVASGIERWTGRPVELRLHDTKGLEFNYRTYDVHKDLDGEAQWRPDYVVFSAGENIKAFTNKTEGAIWRDDLVQAGRLLKSANPEAKIVFKTTFWCVPEKNREIVASAKAVGGAVADIGTRGNDRRNQAVGLFKHGGVACHPGDAGMKMIAEKVLQAFGFPEPQHELPPAQ